MHVVLSKEKVGFIYINFFMSVNDAFFKKCKLFFYCAVFFLNWGANQSCFSPLLVFFNLQQKEGAVPVIIQQSPSGCSSYPQMEKNRQMCC